MAIRKRNIYNRITAFGSGALIFPGSFGSLLVGFRVRVRVRVILQDRLALQKVKLIILEKLRI